MALMSWNNDGLDPSPRITFSCGLGMRMRPSRFGRKRATLIALIWSCTTGTLMAFAPSIIWYNVLRFLTAVGTTGYYEACLFMGG